VLPVELNRDAAEMAWAAIPMLASRHRLTVYDATCLELARRKGLPLATLDEALATAGRAEGIVVLGAA
jgi:predicted nucleic acid-binding protein